MFRSLFRSIGMNTKTIAKVWSVVAAGALVIYGLIVVVLWTSDKAMNWLFSRDETRDILDRVIRELERWEDKDDQ